MGDFYQSNLFSPSTPPEIYYPKKKKSKTGKDSTNCNIGNQKKQIEKDLIDACDSSVDFGAILNKLVDYLKVRKTDYAKLDEEFVVSGEDYLCPIYDDEHLYQSRVYHSPDLQTDVELIGNGSVMVYIKKLNPMIKSKLRNFNTQIVGKLFLAIKQKAREMFGDEEETQALLSFGDEEETQALLSETNSILGQTNERKYELITDSAEHNLSSSSAYVNSGTIIKSSKKSAKNSFREGCRNLAFAYSLLSMAPLMPYIDCDTCRKACHYDPLFNESFPIKTYL